MAIGTTLAAAVSQELAAEDRNKNQQRWLAFIVGVVAFALPAVLYLGPIVFDYGCERYSLSHFYYSPFWGGVFISMLAFIGTFMITYRGDTWDETLVTSLSGICAFIVALVPATSHGCLAESGTFRARAFAQFTVDRDGAHTMTMDKNAEQFFKLSDAFIYLPDYGLPFDWKIHLTDLHYGAALVLFAGLMYYCFVVLTRSKSYHKQQSKVNAKNTALKNIRNTIYISCGLLILLSMVMLGRQFIWGDQSLASDWNKARGTFFWEAVALYAFGVSWLVKGRIYQRIPFTRVKAAATATEKAM